MTTNQPSSGKLVRRGLAATVVVALVALLVFYLRPQGMADQPVGTSLDPVYSSYVSAYTAGMVSRASTIKIQLVDEVASTEEVGQEVAASVFSFSPAIPGTATWADTRTIEFKPESYLQPGQQYELAFELGKLLEVPDALERFAYAFSTLPQNFSVQPAGLSTYEDRGSEVQKYTGELLTADVTAPEDVKRVLTASYQGKQLPVSWQHFPEDNRHLFTVEDIKREESQRATLELKWNGAPIGTDYQDQIEVEVPARDEFTLLSTRVLQTPSQLVELRFSDRLDPTQVFEGLVQVGSLQDLSYQASGNVLLIYPPVRQTGSLDLRVYRGLKNTDGASTDKGFSEKLAFEQEKPAVRFIGKGSILPASEGLVVPFEAVGLRAVDVRVLRVFEKNIPQFLQVNGVSGNEQMKRVGRPVAVKRIPLGTAADGQTGKWKRYSLDLSELINAEPGAIYQVAIGFRKEYTAYDCGDSPMGTSAEAAEEMAVQDNLKEFEDIYDQNTWDYYEQYYYEYDWENQENPCSGAYYGGRRTVYKNILASDLGVIAKRSSNGDLLAVVTNLKTAQPVANAQVKLYNYQQQLLAQGNTDADGKLQLETDKKPWLLVVASGNQKNYLKVDDGTSLSVSNFDVSGAEVKSGLKGFIYGERGVWRPGDSLHLTFLLEEQQTSALPKGHPLVFELLNPRGAVMQKMVSNKGESNFYSFSTATAADAPTGNWQARVQVGDAVFTRNLRVETVKPNRLKINLDFGKEQLTASSTPLEGTLEARWLHGATASNLKAEVEVTLRNVKTAFEGFENYTFDHMGKDYNPETEQVFKGQTNDNGLAVIKLELNTREAAPGMLRADFTSRVYEQGGSFSISRQRIPYHPFSSYTGLDLPQGDQWGYLAPGRQHRVQIATVSSGGQPVNRRVRASIYRLDWRWWWNRDYEDLSYYLSRRSVEPVFAESISTSSGKATLNFSEEDGGRYFFQVCDTESGHCAGEVFYIGWSSRQEMAPEVATMLAITTDQEKYKAGDEVKLVIPGNENARAFISLENGSSVLKSWWADLQAGETTVTFEVTENMAPNVYAHVTLVQPHGSSQNDLPMRMYGILPIMAEDPDTRLQPEVQVPQKIEPGQAFEVKVAEDNGQPMTYTLAMVEDGLLDLTNFQTPDPWGHFYAREALGVTTWDIYDEVIGAFNGKFGRVLAVGGDGFSAPKETPQANRFQPVVKFAGPFELGKGKTAVHQFTMPNYVGSVRFMVVAGTPEGAWGSTEATVPVKKPLMVLATLPRILGPGEELALPVNIFAMEEGLGNVEVSVKASDLLNLQGNATQSVSFSRTGDQVTNFPLRVKEGTGVAWVEVEAVAGKYKATHRIEIDVRNPNPLTTRVVEAMLEAGQSWSHSLQPFGIAGTNKAVLEVSSLPPVNLADRLNYLVQYPYGCVEQTTSSVFPQLFVGNVMQIDEATGEEIDQNVRAGIRRLQALQTNDGGLAYWPGETESSAWGTIYGTHFLLEAKSKGYNVPFNMLSALEKYLKRSARNWRDRGQNSHDDLVQAYRLYVLALAGKPETGAMNRLREIRNLSLQGTWRLAAAYSLLGKEKAASDLGSNISTNVTPYQEMSHTYGSDTRDEAMILETLSLMGRRKEAMNMYRKVAEKLSSPNNWMSTQTTAFSLIAVLKFSEKVEQSSGGLLYDFAFGGEASKEAQTALPMVQQPVPVTAGQATDIKLKNKGKGVMFVRLMVEGAPARGEETATSNGLQLSVNYIDSEGAPVDASTLEQGTSFVASVTVGNPGTRGDYEELALEQVFPSGWEIMNYRMDGGSAPKGSSNPEYQDIRDDRVYTFFDLKAGQRKTFKVRLTATYAGEFYLPAVQCHAMYDRSISASTTGQTVVVEPPVAQ